MFEMKSAPLTVFLLAFLIGGSASAKTRVVTTTTGLKALAMEVGGEHVIVDAMASPLQDPHFVDGRPSLVVLLNRADLLLHIGLGLEDGWLPPLLVNARNRKIQGGQPGNLNASRHAGPLLSAAGAGSDRRFGDVHPGGNPHFLYHPRYALRVARAIADRLSSLEPDHKVAFTSNLLKFETRLKNGIGRWEARMAPHKGKSVVGYHQSLIYLTSWFGLSEMGFVEPVPGINPDPRHLAGLILGMRKRGVPLVISEPWYNAETTRVVAEKAKAQLLLLPGDVGARGAQSYEEWMNGLVGALSEAFAAAHPPPGQEEKSP
jgi:zinc/manganese transport system substrate-binding protein